jgi:hypothetical protein
MNDFTKEELQFLYECMDDEISTFRLTNNHYCCTMRDKIQSMIDSYCEHIPSDAHYEQFRWQLCQKCGVQYK